MKWKCGLLIIIPAVLLLMTPLSKNLFAGQDCASKLSPKLSHPPSETGPQPRLGIQNLSQTKIGDLKSLNSNPSNPQSAIQNPKFGKTEVMQKTKKLQMPFIANNGQTDEKVAFYANTFGGTVFVTKDGEIVYSLPSPSPNPSHQGRGMNMDDVQCDIGANGRLPLFGADTMNSPDWMVFNPLLSKEKFFNSLLRKNETRTNNPCSKHTGTEFVHATHSMCNPESAILNRSTERSRRSPKSEMKSVALKENASSSPLAGEGKGEGVKAVALKEELVGGKINEIKGEVQSVTNVNYFKGKDPSKWKTNISTYDIVSLGEVYEGIELKLKAYGNNVEKLFYVRPGADPDQIKIRLSGIQSSENPPPTPASGGHRGLSVNENGELVAETELGPVKFTKPIAYQEIDGKRVEGGICQWKLDTFKNNLDSNHRVFSVFGLLIQAATGALGGLGEIPLKRSG